MNTTNKSYFTVNDAASDQDNPFMKGNDIEDTIAVQSKNEPWVSPDARRGAKVKDHGDAFKKGTTPRVLLLPASVSRVGLSLWPLFEKSQASRVDWRGGSRDTD